MFSTAAQTSDLNLDDGTLFVDSSENRVAIGNTAPAEALDITGNLTLRARGYLKLQDDAGGQFVAIRAPATVSSSVTYTFPAADGSSGQSLSTDGSGTLSWSTVAPTAGTGVTVSGTAVSIGQAVATSDSPTFTNLTLSGNLTVNGSTVTNSATNTTIEDLLIELGTGTSGSPSSDAGIVIERGSSDNVFMGWDESADVIVLGTGSFTGASSGNLTITPATLHVGSIGIGNASPDVSLDIGSKTDAVHVPVGTTAQRPGSPAAGYFRYNSTTSQFEGYTSSWGAIGGGSTTLNTDLFTGNGSTVDFTISQAIDNENKLIVFVDGVYQNPDAYSMPANTTLRFSAAPANGRKIAAYSVAGVVSGTNLNIDSFTGDGSDTTFTLSITPVSENNTLVYVGGVYQQKSTYSVSGTTLTFSTAPPSGASIEVATMNQTNINVPVDDTITTAKLVDANVTTAKIADNAVTADKIADNVALPGNITTTGTLAPTGVLTANAGVVVDNITIDGTEIDLSSGDLIVDVAGDITLDAGGGDINFKDDTVLFGQISNSSGLYLVSNVSDADIFIRGNDGGSYVNALTIDMSDAGSAHFNSRVGIGVAAHATAGLNITASGSNQNIRLNNGSELGIIDLDSDGDLILWAHGSENIKFVNGTGVGTTRVTIDSSGNTTFGGQVIAPNGSTSGYYLKQTGGTATPRVTNDGNEWTIIRPGASGADVAINNYANTHNRFVFRDEGIFKIADAELSHPTAYTYQTLKVQNNGDVQACLDLHKSDGVKVATFYGDQNQNQGFLSATYGWVLRVDNNGNVFPTASLGLAGGSNTGLSCELYHPNTSTWQTLGIKNNDDSTQCAIEMFSSQGTKRCIVYGVTDYYGFLTQSASWSLKGDSSGNWVATGTITGSSDIRLKENINTIPNALEKVTKLRGVEFTWKSRQEKEIGVIAQEVKEVVPELVTITDARTDADPDGLEDLHSMKYQNTVALLIEAIKELKAEVDELKGNK